MVPVWRERSIRFASTFLNGRSLKFIIDAITPSFDSLEMLKDGEIPGTCSCRSYNAQDAIPAASFFYNFSDIGEKTVPYQSAYKFEILTHEID